MFGVTFSANARFKLRISQKRQFFKQIKTIQDSFLEKTGKELLEVCFLINVLHALLCFSWGTWSVHSLAVSYVLSHFLKGHLKWSGLFPSQVLVHLVASPTKSSSLVVFGFGE